MCSNTFIYGKKTKNPYFDVWNDNILKTNQIAMNTMYSILFINSISNEIVS